MRFIEIKAQQWRIKDRIDDCIKTVLSHGKCGGRFTDNHEYLACEKNMQEMIMV